ncbi:hypothetical protein SAMN04488029_2206 [Reichenbachiella faecimaris]|uniref:Uncharacterized protein n=1 Tax=Reichenbachiella faecimaris TaxID=692418 RepID=A0A1W2GDV2_REIFA|nr:hypothetical protein [Reichenbachiella faecimaris]SMD34850.1 hypothetical protein SAMN04488029_2206 [Reichenbachiella faecimaris]
MAMSASCTITNQTGSEIMITQMGKVNDDAGFTAPSIGTKVSNGESFTISMGNDSFPIAPRGVGFNMGFIDFGNQQLGSIYLDDPAVGAHQFNYGNTPVFDYPTQNPGGNVYDIQIKVK